MDKSDRDPDYEADPDDYPSQEDDGTPLRSQGKLNITVA